MVAILVDTAATITDEILNLHDRLIGSFFTKDKSQSILARPSVPSEYLLRGLWG
jgi:hypothetical protein